MTSASQIRLLPILLLAFTAASCSWTGKDGMRHSVLLGVGILSSKEIVKGTATVTKTTLFGVALQNSPTAAGLLIGYQDSLITQIPPNWEGQFSLATTPEQPFTLTGSLGQPFTAAPCLEQPFTLRSFNYIPTLSLIPSNP